MSRKVDTAFVTTRRNEREDIVAAGKRVEEFEAAGKTSEQLKEDAKEVLGIGEDGSILLEFDSIMRQQNLQISAFIALVSFSSKALQTKLLTEEELSGIVEIENRVAKVIAERYDVDVEDLYSEGE